MENKNQKVMSKELYDEIVKVLGKENIPILLMEFELPMAQILEHLYAVHSFSKLQISQMYLIYSKYFFELSKLTEVQK